MCSKCLDWLQLAEWGKESHLGVHKYTNYKDARNAVTEGFKDEVFIKGSGENGPRVHGVQEKAANEDHE